MKAPLTLFAAALLGSTTFLQAQTNVLFSVDMNGVAAESFDPAVDVLRVAGDFQSWTPQDATMANVLTDADGNGVFAVTLPVTNDSLEFKYVINNWGDGTADRNLNEFADNLDAGDCTNDGSNRLEIVTLGDETVALPTYMFASCEVSTLAVSSARDLTPLTGVSIGPNPMTSQATLQLPNLEGETFAVRLLGMDGREYFTARDVTGTSLDIARDNLPAGTYLVEVVAAQAQQRAVVQLIAK